MAGAGLDAPGKPRLRFHDLRHTYASLLIAQGVDVAYVSRQLGHANITTTLNTYTHLFDHARNAEAVKQRLEEEFGGILGAAQVHVRAAADHAHSQRRPRSSTSSSSEAVAGVRSLGVRTVEESGSLLRRLNRRVRSSRSWPWCSAVSA